MESKSWFKFFSVLLLVMSFQTIASEKDYRLHIHVHYQQKSDSWTVRYQLPIATDHIAFSRRSNFDRTKIFQIDTTKFKWDRDGGVLLIRSLNGEAFNSIELSFKSYYKGIVKDYEQNIKFTDDSVLLYTNHLTLGANVIEDRTLSPFGASFKGVRFHFYAPQQHITFLGKRFFETANWDLERQGTYVYFGNLKPIETENMIAIVDPKLPQWVWQNTEENFPKLFDYYQTKTGQKLNFKPVVYFNYEQVNEDMANYSGGTLDGLVQLSINGKQWKDENQQQFNSLFHFLAHEAAHFWNGQMFSNFHEGQAWMHEGSADAFAYFASQKFGLIDEKEVIANFENTINQCLLGKQEESLEQSAELGKYRNYYTCGAAIAFASDLAIKAKDSSMSVFDLWKQIFETNIDDREYDKEDYLAALTTLTESDNLAVAFDKFLTKPNLNNHAEISSWFANTSLQLSASELYPKQAKNHWGKEVLIKLMRMHCNGVSLWSYDDYAVTDKLEGCKPFSTKLEIQYLDDIEILADGVIAYKHFQRYCAENKSLQLQNRDKKTVTEVQCIEEVPEILPYFTFTETSYQANGG